MPDYFLLRLFYSNHWLIFLYGIICLQGKTSGNCKYNLFAVSNHFGNLEGGHYTAYCKNVFDHKWYDFNDSTVTRTNGPICTKESYVLLYSSLDFDDYNDLFG